LNSVGIRKRLATAVGVFGTLVFLALSRFAYLVVRSSHLITARDYARAVGEALAFYAAVSLTAGLAIAAYEVLTDDQALSTELPSVSELVVHNRSGTISDFHQA